MALQISPRLEGPVRVVGLGGRLDNLTAPEFERQIAPVLAGPGTHLVLDAARLEYISSAGLRVLLGTLKQLRKAGGRMAVAGPTPSVVEVMEISGFRALLEIQPDVPHALTAVAG